MSEVWGKVEWVNRLKVRVGSKAWIQNEVCATLGGINLWSRPAKMRQDWMPRGCSISPWPPSPEHSWLTLSSYHRVRNSATILGNKVQLWAGESRKVEEEDLQIFMLLRSLQNTLKTFLNCCFFVCMCGMWGGGGVKNLTLIRKTLSSCDWRNGNSPNFSRKLICIKFSKTHFGPVIHFWDRKRGDTWKSHPKIAELNYGTFIW